MKRVEWPGGKDILLLEIPFQIPPKILSKKKAFVRIKEFKIKGSVDTRSGNLTLNKIKYFELKGGKRF